MLSTADLSFQMTLMFDQLDDIPPGFLEVRSTAIEELLPRPTLIHLPGIRQRPLFVSILQHGNEEVGLLAVQEVLKKYRDHKLPRGLSLFVANVSAATQNVRRLPGQPDYNRNWPSSEQPDSPEQRMLCEIVEEMRRREVFASIDLHNNTGTNPHYACVCSTALPHLHLASLFSRTMLYFTRPRGVQTMAFMSLCPSITCECGKVGDRTGVTRAAELIDACLHLAEFPDHELPAGDVHLFHTVATVKVPADVTIGFGEATADLVFPNDLDRWNFNELGPGAEIAIRPGASTARLIVEDEQGRDVHADYISEQGHSLRLKRKVLPSMLTRDQRIIRQDCLGYFMERYDGAHP